MTTPDPYRWLFLEDPGDPRTVGWEAEREAEYERVAAGWAARDRFTAELDRLTASPGAAGAPRPAGERLFSPRLAPAADHPHLVVSDGHGTRTLVDPAAADPTGHTTLEAWEPSPQGRYLSYQLAAGGTERSSLYVLDAGTGQPVDGPIDRVRRTGVAWLADESGFYYVRHAGPRRQVYLHRLGADPDTDAVVFGADRDGAEHYVVRGFGGGRWLVLTASAGAALGRDVWLADLAGADPARPAFRAVQVGVGARAAAKVAGGTCYVRTEHHAPRGRLVRADAAEPGPHRWRELIAEDPEAVLEDFAVLDRELLAVWTRHAVSEITRHDPVDGRLLGRLPIPAHSSVGTLRAGASAVWFVLSRFTSPPAVYRYDGQLRQWPAPAAERPPEIDVRQVVCASRDGTPVRMFVLSAAGPAGAHRPAILTGYGGFGVSLTPQYSPEAVAWVAAGGVYAVANVRGGGEEGAQWHRAGTGAGKQRAFEDFEAAAELLVGGGWTTPRQLGIWGSSNGGLLVGAALTRHPERYAAAVAVAPLLDMERYERSGLGQRWVAEYGSASDPEQLRWLLSYSPYHHIRAGVDYPAVLFMVFDGDTRVDPGHARKMCAALRTAAGSGTQPVLYRLERGAGHGQRSRSSQLLLQADLLSFLADRLGLRAGDPVEVW